MASYATCASAILAEPRALLSFAGPRVLQLAGLPVDERQLNGEAYAQEFCHCDFSTLLEAAGLKVRRVIPDGYGFMHTWWADRAA